MNPGRDTTEVIQSQQGVMESVLSFFARARDRLDMCVSYVGPRSGTEFVNALQGARKRGVKTRLITEVSRDNAGAMQAASGYMEVRHVGGLRGNSWAVSDSEYLSSLAVGEFRASHPLIRSTANPLVAEHQSIFDALWERGEALAERTAVLRSGSELPEMEIVREPARAKEMYLSLAAGARTEILLIFPTPAAFRRDERIGLVRALEERTSKGVSVRLLVPVDREILARLSRSASSRGIAYRPTHPAEARDTVTVIVVDRSASLTIDERDPSEQEFEKAFGSAIITTKEPRVRQSIRMFDRVWRETELRQAEKAARESEEVSRKRAELMQDILTHDIRNFNQVARLNAELLGDRLKDRETSERISAILRAVDGSTRLIERAKKLGSIMAARGVELSPTSLKGSFDRSVVLVKKGNPDVALRVDGRLSGQVLADELLDEVFVNVISNAVKYTEGSRVSIALSQEPDSLPGNSEGPRRRCWKVSISDRGKGIPDSHKPSVFRRYLETAKGSGLGLSIVHALVTDRYGGRVAVKDRVADDFSKGTTVEIWLPRP